MSIIKRQRSLNFEPGAEHLYSNTGYTLLAQIVKRVSGQSLREFTSERIFKPLGMDDTFFRDDFREIVKSQAYGYISEEGAEGSFLLSVTNFDTVGATSLLTTASDLMKWQLNFENPVVGTKALIEQMLVRGKLNDGDAIDYAFGLVHGEYREQDVIAHSGGDAGYRSHLIRFPEHRFSVAILCNTPVDTGAMARQVADVLIPDKLSPPESSNSDSTSELPVTLGVEVLEEKTGPFWNEKTGTALGFAVTDEKLYLDYQSQQFEMMAISDTRFRMELTGMVIEFSPDANSVTTFIGEDNETTFIRTKGFDPDEDSLQEYVGTYQSEELEVLYRLFLDADDVLTLKWLKSEPHSLKPHMRDVFVGGSGALRFQRDENRKVSGFTISSGRIRNLVFSKM